MKLAVISEGTPDGVKWCPYPLMGGERPYAVYPLGTAYMDPTHGLTILESLVPGMDRSGNERHGTITGAGAGAKWMACSSTNYMTLPFNLPTLYGSNGCTLAVIARANADPFVALGVMDASGGGSAKGLAIMLDYAATYAASQYNYLHGGSSGPVLGTSYSPAPDSNFELIIATASPSGGFIYRGRIEDAPEDVVPVTTTTPITVGATNNILVGTQVPGGSFSGTGDIAFAMPHDSPLTIDQARQLHADWAQIMAYPAFDLPIAA